MALLLFCHVANRCSGGRRSPAEHGELSFVNAYRTIFAGVINADHRADIDGRIRSRDGRTLVLRLMISSLEERRQSSGRQRYERIIAGHRNSEESPRRGVAPRHWRIEVECPREHVARRAGGRSRPPVPLDAGVVDADRA